MKICTLIGSPAISGGTYVIFQHCLYLQEKGFDVTIVALDDVNDENLKWHPEAKLKLNFKKYEEVDTIKFDLCIVTWWKTVFEIHKINYDKIIYFVQSIESRFYPQEEIPLRRLVDSTYELGLPVITEATWIKDYLENKYKSQVVLAKNGIRKDVYTLHGPAFAERIPGKVRILVEGPINVDFKNVKKSIEICSKSRASEIWLLTSDDIQDYPKVDRVFSRLNIYDVAKVYRSCDILVKLSYVEGMFGPPLEIFHCGGTAIVYDVTGHDEYMIHKDNSIIVETNDENKVLEEINKLCMSTKELDMLKAGAARTAENWIDWEQSSHNFYEQLLKSLEISVTVKRDILNESIKLNFSRYVQEENQRKEENTKWYNLKNIKRLTKKVFTKILRVNKINQVF